MAVMKHPLSKKTSICARPQYDLLGDVEVEEGPELKNIMVTDMDRDFHFIQRKTSGTWANIGIFKQV